MSRAQLTHTFLWIGVLSWGLGAGAKLFDLLVLARAWGSAPPASLAFYPYGRAWPIDPGDFFQPLSVVLLIASLGSLTAGWKTPWSYRVWLLLPLAAFVLIWIATPTVFWPMINELYRIAHGKASRTDADVAQLVHHWMIADSIRMIVIAGAFACSVRAISLPYAEKTMPRDDAPPKLPLVSN